MSVCCSERAALPFLVRAVGLTVNIVLNWILIFGHFGVRAMGVNGAAIATVIARFSELAVMLSVVYGKKMIQAAGFSQLFSIRKDLVVQFLKTATPVIFNEMAWALGITAYTWVFARISSDAMVIITIVQNIERLMLVFFHGGGNAAGVFIGKAVGAQKYKQAYLYAKKLMFLSFCTALVLSAAFILLRPVILMPYNISEGVYRQAMHLLFLVAVMMNVKSMTFLLIVGVFRNGGDTRTACLIDIGSVYRRTHGFAWRICPSSSALLCLSHDVCRGSREAGDGYPAFSQQKVDEKRGIRSVLTNFCTKKGRRIGRHRIRKHWF